jgi:hypothetical protein
MFGELGSDQIEQILGREVVGRIGCHDGGRPYVVPLTPLLPIGATAHPESAPHDAEGHAHETAIASIRSLRGDSPARGELA